MATLQTIADAILNEKETKVLPENIVSGITIFDVEGTAEVGVDTSDADATCADILAGKTAYVNGQKIEGEIMDLGIAHGSTSNFNNDDDLLLVVEGTAFDSGYITGDHTTLSLDTNKLDLAEAVGLTADKIVEGNTILGIEGTAVVGEGIDTSDATATSAEILEGFNAYVNDEKIEGALRNLSGASVNAPVNQVKYTGTSLEIVSNPSTFGYMDDLTEIKGSIQNETITNAVGLTAEKITKGTTVMGVTGTAETLDTSDATVAAIDIRADKTAYANGKKVVGTMPEYNSQTITPSATTQTLTNGYYTNLKIMGDPDLTAENIKKGVSIFNIVGTLETTITEGTETVVTADTLIWKIIPPSNPNAWGGTSITDPGEKTYDYTYYQQTPVSEWSTVFERLSYNEDIDATTPRVGDFLVGTEPYTYANGEKFDIVAVVTKIVEETTDYIGFEAHTIAYQPSPKTLAEQTADATATAATIFEGKTAYVKGELISGTYNAAAAGDTTFYPPSKVSFAYSDDTSMDLTGLPLGTVSNLGASFAHCPSLVTLNFDSIDTSGCTNMYAIFMNNPKLNFEPLQTALNFKVTPKVTAIGAMFQANPNLYNFTFPSHWNSSGVTLASHFFNNCRNLNTVDLTNMDYSNVTAVTNMFGSCNNLTNVVLGPNFAKMPEGSNLSTMFYGWNYGKFTNPQFDIPLKADCTAMFKGAQGYSTKGADLSGINFYNAASVSDIVSGIRSVGNLILNYGDMPYLTTLNAIFGNIYNVSRSIQGVSELNAPNATTIGRGIIYGASTSYASTLNLCNWNIPNIPSLFNAFNSMLGLKDLDLSNWKAPNVTNVVNMFVNLQNLTNLNVQNLTMPLITNAQTMIRNCPKLSNESLDQIMNLMTVTSLDGSSKTLAYIGLTSAQAAICETLPNWTNLQAAGWTTGY